MTAATTAPAKPPRCRRGESKTPWRLGPHADTAKAQESYQQYRARGKRGTK